MKQVDPCKAWTNLHLIMSNALHIYKLPKWLLYLSILIEPVCNPVCQNGGTCVSGRCLCPQGYVGVSCENSKYQIAGPRFKFQSQEWAWVQSVLLKWWVIMSSRWLQRFIRVTVKAKNYRSRGPGSNVKQGNEPYCKPPCLEGTNCVSSIIWWGALWK